MSHRARLVQLELRIDPDAERSVCGAIQGWVPAPLLYDRTEPWLNSSCPVCGSPLGPDDRAFPSNQPGTHVKAIVWSESRERDRAQHPASNASANSS